MSQNPAALRPLYKEAANSNDKPAPSSKPSLLEMRELARNSTFSGQTYDPAAPSPYDIWGP